ncbi:MAG: DUF2997 domain-containing protein [Verrucomicrobiota bacterium]
MKTIIVEINPAGEVAIETTGFKGNACEKATAALEAALGNTASRKKKPEYFATGEVRQTVGGKQ